VTHRRRPERTQKMDSGNSLGSCPVCGRPMYMTRTAAKRAARQAQRIGDELSRPYQCGQFWHR
jgi:hypothetical protein